MRKIYKERFDKKMGGVCGGLAQFFRVDSSIIRLLFVMSAIFSAGLTIIIYLILWLVLPVGPIAYVEASYKRLFRSRRDRKIAGICGGLAKYFRVDSTIVRIIFILVLFLTGFFPMFIVYVTGIAVIPEE